MAKMQKKRRGRTNRAQSRTNAGKKPREANRSPSECPALPTAAMLESLPRWAIVAYLARCAWLGQPLLESDSTELKQLVANAAGVAQEAGEFGFDMGGGEAAALNLVRAADNHECRSDPEVVLAVSAALVAALANIGDEDSTTSLAQQGGQAMARILTAAATSTAWRQLLVPISRDFESARKFAARQRSTADSRFPPTIFGGGSVEEQSE